MGDARIPLQFSASSLQDYVDCPRRFQLRYAWHVDWPAPEAELGREQERRTRLGQELHRLIHQHLVGVPEALLGAAVHDPQLACWWRAYLDFARALGDASLLAETALSMPVAGHRVQARYDVLASYAAGSARSVPAAERATNDSTHAARARWLIVDWKTYRRHPGRQALAERLQTRVYPAVLALAGASLNLGRSIDAEQIELRFWLAEYPEDAVSFSYSRAKLELDITYITGLVEQIAGRMGVREGGGSPSTVWPQAADPRKCLHCCYRSLCQALPTAARPDDCADDETWAPPAGEAAADGTWDQVQDTAC